jgi:hypothetical protein
MKLIAVVFNAPIFSIPGFLAGAVGGFTGRVYMAAKLSVKG